ncbi:Leucine-rich repeat-containing protein 43 [Kappamyces sp. JEL0680]|nr:Leucine-rich repeat-containing protein 43 [Kappamyces sp. JEL0680]
MHQDASHAIYRLANQALGISKKGEMRGLLAGDGTVDAYIDGSFDWCDELLDIKKQFLACPRKWKAAEFKSKIKTLHLQGQHIDELDTGLLEYVSLQELSLTGNCFAEVKNLPPLLKVLHLNANTLSDLPMLGRLSELIHLGIAHNDILSLGVPDIMLHLPLSLVSLDLAWNRLTDLSETISAIRRLPKLKNLVLLGNPICLLPSYNASVVAAMPRLLCFDEKSVTNLDMRPRTDSANGTFQ